MPKKRAEKACVEDEKKEGTRAKKSLRKEEIRFIKRKINIDTMRRTS